MKNRIFFIPLSLICLLGCGRPASKPASAKTASPAKVEPEGAPAKADPKVAPAAPLQDLPPDLTRAKAEKELEALLARLGKDAGRPIDVRKVLSDALPELADRVDGLSLPQKAVVRVLPLRGARLAGALLDVVDPKADKCDTQGLNAQLHVALVRDPATGQSELRIESVSSDDALVFRGKDVKVTFVDGARDPNLFILSYDYSNQEDECVDRMVSVDGDYQIIFTFRDGDIDQMPPVKDLETEHEPGREVKTSSNLRWFTGGATDLLAVTVFEQTTYIETGDGMDGRTATCVRTSSIYVYGPKGWEPFDGPLTKARQLYPVLKAVPGEGAADTVEACEALSDKL